MSSFFSDVRQEPVPTSAGPCDLPILYRDASIVGIFHRVDPGAASRLLEGVPLEPWVAFGGKATVLTAVFEYRDTTVGVYNELGIAVLTKRPGSAPSRLGFVRDMTRQEEQAFYVVNLPVTTEAACAAGKEIWGYPKYVTGIDTDLRPRAARFGLEGELEIDIGGGLGPRLPNVPIVTFTVKDGHLLRTVVRTGGRARWTGGGSVRLRVLGDGPCASTVTALGLDRTRAAAAFRSDDFQAILPAGIDLGAARRGE